MGGCDDEGSADAGGVSVVAGATDGGGAALDVGAPAVVDMVYRKQKKEKKCGEMEKDEKRRKGVRRRRNSVHRR